MKVGLHYITLHYTILPYNTLHYQHYLTLPYIILHKRIMINTTYREAHYYLQSVLPMLPSSTNRTFTGTSVLK
jgi:hypothetical protein